MEVLSDWRPREAAHRDRAERLGASRRWRVGHGVTDPVDDFLWDYYGVKPRDLVRWHPGAGVAITDDGALGWRDGTRWARPVATASGAAITLDVPAFMADRGDGVGWIHRLLAGVESRPGHFGCMGWHEWAMVYRLEGHRHPLPLRLGQDGTDTVIEAAHVRCTHYDAFRFFTPAAAPLNHLQPTRELQLTLEQPACLHVNMDCFKYARKLGPACPGELLLDTFELAGRIRRLDMAASPYDCTSLGLEPVPVETAAGRAAYVAAQRGFAAEAHDLRRRLLGITAVLVGAAQPTPS